MNITRLADQCEILVRIHRLSLLFSHYVSLYIPTVMTSLLSDQSQRLWSAHTNPFTLFWGLVLTTPPIFELANQSPLFSQMIFALDQSERSIFPTTNQNADRKVSLWCAYHYCGVIRIFKCFRHSLQWCIDIRQRLFFNRCFSVLPQSI